MHLRNAAIGLVQREVQATVAQVRRRAQAASHQKWPRRPPTPLVARSTGHARNWWRVVRGTRATAAQVHDWRTPDLFPEPGPDTLARCTSSSTTPAWCAARHADPVRAVSPGTAAERGGGVAGHPWLEAPARPRTAGPLAAGPLGSGAARAPRAAQWSPCKAGRALEPLHTGAPPRRRPAPRLHRASVPPPCRRCSSPPTSRRS